MKFSGSSARIRGLPVLLLLAIFLILISFVLEAQIHHLKIIKIGIYKEDNKIMPMKKSIIFTETGE